MDERSMDDGDGPSDEAYGRVTDPERYRPLHAAADRLLADLESRYEVERTDVALDEDDKTWRRGAERAIRLVPADGGASLTLVFTGFPGVILRAGHAFERPYPVCGCDACDEDPEEEAAELRRVAHDVVAGRLHEERRHRRLGRDTFRIRLTSADGWEESSGSVEPGDQPDAIPVGATSWPAWVPRSSERDPGQGANG